MKKTKLTSIGDKYNRWTVLSNPIGIPKGKSQRLKYYVNCQCDCGTIKQVRETALPSNISKSCGCLQKEATSKMSKRHGMSKTHTYMCWAAMKDRCNNKNYNQYKDYGGRGIGYDPKWEKFEKFYKDMGDSNNLSLERIDNNKNYSKENCKWATNVEQGRNTRRSNKNISTELLRLTIEMLEANILSYKDIANKLSISQNLIAQIAFANNIYSKLKEVKSND